MFAGHFAPVTVLQRYYPDVSPYVFTLGVGVLDVVFGLLTYLGVEGVSPNPHAGHMGVDLHCDYSHSLLGSIVLSLIYGITTGGSSLMPGFLASFSHFIGDILVHNQDILLDPFTKIMIGGTNLLTNFPTFAFYFEAAFCVVCAAFSQKDSRTLIAQGIILFIHFSGKSSTPQLFQKILSLPEGVKQKYAAIIVTLSFIVPGLILGYILDRKKSQVKHNSKDK